MDGQGLFVAIATMFGSVFLSHSGRYGKRQWLLLIGAVIFAGVAILWLTLKPNELTQSINAIASNGWVWLSIIGLLWIYIAFVTHPRPIIEIMTPEQGQQISLSQTVSGMVLPRDGFVQVFTLSRDNKWYSQKAQTNGAIWTVTGNIGSKDAPAGTRYKLVAISGAKQINSPVSKLPRGEAKSRTVVVYRA